MSLFRSLGEILSGRRLHKNTTNNVVVSELWKGCEKLPNEHQKVFRDFVAAASAVAEAFFFDDNHPREINAKNYTIEQFRIFYHAVIAVFVHLYGLANPRLAPSLAASLGAMATDAHHIERLLVRFRKHVEADSSIAGEAYSHLVEEAGIGSPSFESFSVFTSGCLIAYNSTLARHDN